MTEQEINEEIDILDKACRQVAAEFSHAGVQGLRIHALNIAALSRKLDRIEAMKQLAAANK